MTTPTIIATDGPKTTPTFIATDGPATLAGAVRQIWLLDDDGAFSAGLPKPYVDLVVSLSGIHWWRAAPGSPEHRYADGWVTPIQSGPRYARAVGRRRLIGARLEPWAARALFGPLPPGDGTPPPRLDALVGPDGRRLRASLLRAVGTAERFALLTAWLEAQPALRRAARTSPGPARDGASVASLARTMALSPRSLRRQFARESGIAPKAWLRLHRLHDVLTDPLLRDERQPLTAVAHAHGYADQAHFAREIARFTGVTASELRRRPAHLPPHLVPRG